MTCEHLRALEEAILAAGIRETFRGEAWSRNCREWVYFDAYLDPAGVRRAFALPDCVEDHVHRGTHDGSERGFLCAECRDGVLGRLEPADGVPVFPPEPQDGEVVRPVDESLPEGFVEAIDLLANSRSPKRRTGARRLRRMGDPRAGPALLEALEREVRDPRTWETQYQMIMALGECDHRPALPFLEELSRSPVDATILYTALGDALFRLRRRSPHDVDLVLERMEETDLSGPDTREPSLLDGALRAVAMLRMVPGPADVERIVAFVRRAPTEHPIRFWVAAAAAGWPGPETRAFLEETVRSPREDLRRAAESSLRGEYRTWRPL